MLENNFSSTNTAEFNFDIGLVAYSESQTSSVYFSCNQSMVHLAVRMTDTSDVYLIRNDHKTTLVVRDGDYSIYQAADELGGFYIVAGDNTFFLDDDEFEQLEIFEGTQTCAGQFAFNRVNLRV